MILILLGIETGAGFCVTYVPVKEEIRNHDLVAEVSVEDVVSCYDVIVDKRGNVSCPERFMYTCGITDIIKGEHKTGDSIKVKSACAEQNFIFGQKTVLFLQKESEHIYRLNYKYIKPEMYTHRYVSVLKEIYSQKDTYKGRRVYMKINMGEFTGSEQTLTVTFMNFRQDEVVLDPFEMLRIHIQGRKRPWLRVLKPGSRTESIRLKTNEKYSCTVVLNGLRKKCKGKDVTVYYKKFITLLEPELLLRKPIPDTLCLKSYTEEAVERFQASGE